MELNVNARTKHLSWIENVERGNVSCSNISSLYPTNINDLLDHDYDMPRCLSLQWRYLKLMYLKVVSIRQFSTFLDRGLSVEVVDGKLVKQLFVTICQYQLFDCLILLMIRGVEVPSFIDDRVPLIHYISQYPIALSLIEYLFSLDPTLSDYHTFVGWSPLTMACISGDLNVVRFMLSKGASLMHVDLGKKTMLHHAAARGGVPLIDLLLTHGILIDARDSNGKTALHHACEAGNSTAAEYLIRRGADINAEDFIQSTPAKLAYSKDQAVVIHMLLTGHKTKLTGIGWKEMFAGTASAEIAKEEYIYRTFRLFLMPRLFAR